MIKLILSKRPRLKGNFPFNSEQDNRVNVRNYNMALPSLGVDSHMRYSNQSFSNRI